MNNLLPKTKEFYRTKHFEDGGIERLPNGIIKVTMYFSDNETEKINKENTYKSNTSFYIVYGLSLLLLLSILVLPIAMIENSFVTILTTVILYLMGLVLTIIGIYRKHKTRK